jgi:arsenical pump membrane protein
VPSAAAEVIALIILIAVLAFAIIRPKDLPEAVAAVPGALLLLVTGSIGVQDAWNHVAEMLPTIVFLAAVLMLSHLCQEEGLFAAAGDLMARQSRGKPTRLLALVFVVASLVTASARRAWGS